MDDAVLIVFPHNFFELKSGIHKYLYDIVLYLKKKKYQVDLFALSNFESKWRPDDPFDKTLIHNLYLYDAKQMDGFLRWKKIKRKVERKLGVKQSFPNFVTKGMKSAFNQIIKNNNYKYVLIGYVFFSDLVSNLTKEITKIISINDFIALQMVDRDGYSGKIGHLLDAEIKHVNKYDIALCISVDEMFFFSQFARHPKYYFVPFVFDPDFGHGTDFKYDVLFIGFNNIFNLDGLRWFFDKVYKKLNTNIKLLFVGKMVKEFVFPDNSNITLIEYAPDLKKIYYDVKITISPLFGGSGLKTKVLESLSFGKPVVCSTKSMIGLPVKENNGCIVKDDPEEFAYEINELLHNQGYYDDCRKKARLFFSEYFGIDKIYGTLDNVFKTP